MNKDELIAYVCSGMPVLSQLNTQRATHFAESFWRVHETKLTLNDAETLSILDSFIENNLKSRAR